jgi:aryl-alcohol dehydrogenase-like predicted oxidoreductase
MVVDAGPTPDWDYVYKVVDALESLTEETGKTVPQLALNWLLQRPTISTLVIGARDEKQLRANLASTGWNLTPEQVAKLDAASNVPLAYPYWHQVQFEERNPFPTPQIYGG